MYARGGSTPPARTTNQNPETLKFQRFGVFSYPLETENMTKNMTFFSEHYLPSLRNDDETAVSTSLISRSRSSLKRSAYLSNVIAADEWPSIL